MFDAFRKFVSSVLGEREEKAKENLAGNVKLAASVILLEAAYSDREMTAEERRIITEILKDRFELEGEEAGELISFSEEIVKNDTNKWRFMNLINKTFPVEEKLGFMEQVWRIILSDGRIDKYEDHVARRIASVLRIPHHRMIEAKIKVLRGDK